MQIASIRSRLFSSLLVVLLPLFGGGCTQEASNGTLTVRNESVTNRTYSILVNGALIGSIGPGESLSRSFAPGQYALVFMLANTSTPACSAAVATISKGREAILSCRG